MTGEPFFQEEVVFPFEKANLSGLLTLPMGDGAHPAVIFIPGSGSADHTGFGIYPQHWQAFANCGIASLSWDKPGVDGSSGDWTTQTMEDRAREGLAAIQYLKGRREIDASKIGVWGISQAGWVLPLMAHLAPPDIAFIIAVSVPVGSGDEQEHYRIAHQLPADGYTPLEVNQALAFTQLRLYLKGEQAPFEYIDALQSLVREQPWFAEVGEWDQAAYDFLRCQKEEKRVPALLEDIHCPVLTIFGERDTIVNAQQSAQVYATSLAKAGNDDVTIITFPDADHALFFSKTGGMKELQQSFALPADQKRFAPGYLELISSWVTRHFVSAHASSSPK